jgi:2-dehydropantoate 2-reductase
MKNSELSFLVVGAGAIGGITAGLLKRDGYDVEIVCRQSDYASYISNTGIEVSGYCGKFSVKIPAYSSISEVKGKKDIILHATKANDIIESSRPAIGILKENGFVVSMQNGLCEDAIASVFGRERTIGCVTGWGATMLSYGHFEMTSAGDFIIGYPWRQPDKFLNELAEILSSVVPVRVTDNILGHLYSKLIINSCISSLGVLCGLYLGNMLKIKRIRNVFIEIIKEAVAVSDAMKIRLEVFGGKLDFRKFLDGKGFFSNLRRHLTIRIIGFKYRRLKSSSLQSILRGGRSEVDFFNGYIAARGKELGISVPVNTAITEMIHQIEQKKREISLGNFNETVFDIF